MRRNVNAGVSQDDCSSEELLAPQRGMPVVK